MRDAPGYITWKSQDAEDLRNITYFTRVAGLGEVHFSAEHFIAIGSWLLL